MTHPSMDFRVFPPPGGSPLEWIRASSKRCLTIGETALLLGVEPARVAAWVDAGLVKGVAGTAQDNRWIPREALGRLEKLRGGLSGLPEHRREARHACDGAVFRLPPTGGPAGAERIGALRDLSRSGFQLEVSGDPGLRPGERFLFRIEMEQRVRRGCAQVAWRSGGGLGARIIEKREGGIMTKASWGMAMVTALGIAGWGYARAPLGSWYCETIPANATHPEYVICGWVYPTQ